MMDSEYEYSMRGVKKQNLPEKICPVCGRAFTWRKKWADDWENVKYCSQRCRNRKPMAKEQQNG